MNKIKRICSIVLVMVLSLGMAFRLDISGVFAEKEDSAKKQVTALFAAEEAKTITVTDTDKVIYMDLAAGPVTIGKSTYSGYIFVEGNPQKVGGPHNTENKYYIYQSNTTKESSACYKTKTGYTSTNDQTNKTNFKIPQYPRVTYSGESGIKKWTDYINNNTQVKQVSKDWDKYAPNSDRDGTENRITFASESDYTANATIDNIWSTHVYSGVAQQNRTSAGITVNLNNTGINCTDTHIMLQLKGDNRVGAVHYSAGRGNRNTIEFYDGETTGTSGSITVADYEKNFKGNFWSAAIGGADNPGWLADQSDGIVINDGYVYAGTTLEDNCTAIGGGGNNYGGVTINGGTITAVTSGTGTAIGGGIGYSEKGGDTDVVITNGTIYAYNLGIQPGYGFAKFVPAAAIGGGGSNNDAGGLKANITIKGGTIYAQSMGGPGIGGGGSAKSTGGPAKIDIIGGTIIAKSVGGMFGNTKIDSGVSIGGGTGETGGGSVELNISGGTLRAGSIGGGKTTGSGSIGSANVTITDGDIVGQVVMAGGASKACTFTMSGGTIHDVKVNSENGYTITDLNDPRSDVPISFLEKNGGAVWMDDTKGVTTITDGTIENCSAESGGAIYMTGGTFTISGTGAINHNTSTTNGGGVYVGGGTVKVEGGTINNNIAGQDGGGMYLGGGNVDITGGKIDNNIATGDGGGAYIGGDFSITDGEIMSNKSTNGGGIYVNDGIVTMYGGHVDANTATESGGGIHISSTNKDALVDIFSGTISNNKAKSGGGVSVVSDSGKAINVTVGVNCVHPDLTQGGGNYTSFEYPTTSTDSEDSTGCGEAHSGHTNHIPGLIHSSCPRVEYNNATDNGGGFFLKSAQTMLVFYCIIEDGNVAHGKLQCYDMDVQGGHVEIGDKSYHDPTNPSDADVKGNIVMKDSIWVEGGTVDIYGTMENPQFSDNITVEIKEETDHYVDHRKDIQDSTGDYKHYKVHYYENFKGDDGITTGTYVAKDYPDSEHKNSTGNEKYDFIIMSSIFSRPGYKIVGWNSKPDGTGDSYEVNDTYNLAELDDAKKIGAINSAGKKDDSLLILYARWERSGYVLQFDPNVLDGQTYTGFMSNQSVTVGLLDGSQTINKNKFKSPGYEFIGWKLADKDTLYTDGQQITTDFSKIDGDIVVLYAQWKICTHVDYLTYVANGNVLTESCSNCGLHSATATLSAINCVYDGDEHPATSKYSVGWLGGDLTISYAMAASEWDTKDNVDDNWTSNTIPLHAGSYTASITVSETTAEGTIKTTTARIEYVISQVQWATPDMPIVVFSVINGQNAVTLTISDESNLIRYNKSLDNGVIGTWQTSNEFIDLAPGHYYYFYEKKIADRDHSESEISQSEIYLSANGNLINIVKDEGIKVVSSIVGGKFIYTVSADTGYHLRDYNDNHLTAVSNASPITTDALLETPDGIKLDRTISAGIYEYSVQFSQNTRYYSITLEFHGVAKNASVGHKVIDGQVFSDFNDGDIAISRDSAFTAQFTVSDYIPDEYTRQELKFSQGLPSKTTIILKFNGKYWYYKLPTDNVTTIDLTAFTAMGKNNELFTVNTVDATAITFTYQFIVDFSKTINTMTESLQVTLSLVANIAKEGVPNIPAEGATHVSLGIEQEATFTLVASENGDSATITGTYTASFGKASIWNDRNTALVLTATSEIPADAKLTTVVDGATTRYAMRSGNKFIIPLGELGNKEVNVTLNSSLFTSTEKNFAFTAEWYVSESSVDNSPLNGDNVANCDVSFTCKKDAVPSVKIDGTKHICKAGEQLDVDVSYAGIILGEQTTITAYLQAKTNGQYVDTGAKVAITNDLGNPSKVTFNMGQMNKGSYRIIVIVKDKGANILQVPYYFVIE